MSRRQLSQTSFFDAEFVDPNCVPSGSLIWLLARHRGLLFPGSIVGGWRGKGTRGRRAWPADVLGALLLLRWSEEGMSRLGSCRRARYDVQWRAAMGLAMGAETPTEKTVREFERFLLDRHPETDVPRFLMLHEHWTRLSADNVLGDDAPVWAMDSTPMHCYGAVLDTVRLLGDGLRRLTQTWARATRSTPSDVAASWKISELVAAKSTKGAFAVNWRDAEQRSGVLTELAERVTDAVTDVRRQLCGARPGLRKALRRQGRHLLRVITDNLEADEGGRLVIAQRVARDRIASLTDPEARHGRKSKSRVFTGFKVHLLGDLVSGLLVSGSVTPGNTGDGVVAHRLVRRATRLLEGIDVVLGDTAYTGAEQRVVIRATTGARIIAPPAPIALVRPEEGLNKSDFVYDAHNQSATCLNGVAATKITFIQRHGNRRAPRATWTPEACAGCPFTSACPTLDKGRRHGVIFHPFESELRSAVTEWEHESTRRTYRRRAEFERLVHQVTRRGARRARSFGIAAAKLQLHAIMAVNNLTLLAHALARDEEQRPKRAA